MTPAAPDRHETLAQAWVLLQLGLHEQAARLAGHLFASAWGAGPRPGDGCALWVGAVDILHAAGQGVAARAHIRDRVGDASAGAELAGEWGTWLLVHDADDALAAQCLQVAADAQPDSYELLAWLTLALARQGSAEPAWPRWQALFGRLGDSASAREHGARVWAWLRRRDLARQCLQGIATPAEPSGSADDMLRHARLRHLWRALRDEAPEPGPAPDLLREEFNRAAAHYDTHLQALDNRGPQLLRQALQRCGIQPGAALTVLDAGCGTGLCGDVLRPVAARLEGLDLSPAMLDQARTRGLYDALHEEDLCQAAAPRGFSADLVVCWDVLVYFGDLGPPLAALAGRLAPGGRLLALVEAADSGRVCGVGGRHAHGQDHLLQALAAAGLQALWLETVPQLRREFGSPVACHVVAATS